MNSGALYTHGAVKQNRESMINPPAVNPTCLLWAREQAGYEHTHVAPFLRVAVETLCEWERGTGAPTREQLSELASLYRRPAAFFYATGEPGQWKHIPRRIRDYHDTKLTTHEVAELLGVTTRTVSMWLTAGKLPSEVVGRRRKVDLMDALRFKAHREALRDIPRWENTAHARTTGTDRK